MRQLSKLQSWLMMAGGALMVIGAGVFVFGIPVGCLFFLAGTVLFASMQWQQRYEGNDVVVRRLRRTMLLSDVLFVVAAIDMVECTYGFIRPWFDEHLHNGRMLYINYIYNKWVLLLLVAAILQVYTTHRISHELEKEAKKL